MARAALSLALMVATIAVGLWLLLPERFVVNTPIDSLFRTLPVTPPDLGPRLRLPPGFTWSIYAKGLDHARVIRVTPTGDLLVSTPRGGQVWLVPKGSAPGTAGPPRVLLGGLDRPHGIDFAEGWLYVAQSDRVLRVRFDIATGTVSGTPTTLVAGIPNGGMHWSRTLGVGPDGWIYLTIGSGCNACEDDPLRARMARFRPDGNELVPHATGLRNSVGFAWAPWDGQLYATDNGRDLLGDDLPPCELNRIVAGGFYGWPYAWGNRRPDPDLGSTHADRVQASIPPAHEFQAHVAPLGIAFLNGDKLPTTYRHSALVALHGSWNRTRKSGYKVVSLHWDADGKIVERDFLTGFERDEDVIGRPAFVAQGPDGAIYVSDDYTGSIYRIVYDVALSGTS